MNDFYAFESFDSNRDGLTAWRANCSIFEVSNYVQSQEISAYTIKHALSIEISNLLCFKVNSLCSNMATNLRNLKGLVDKLYKDEKIQLILPLSIVQLILNFFNLTERLTLISPLPYLPDDFQIVLDRWDPWWRDHWLIHKRLHFHNSGPWLRGIGKLHFGSNVCENVKILRWKFLYQVQGDQIWINLRFAHPLQEHVINRSTKEDIVPGGTIYGSISKNIFWIFRPIYYHDRKLEETERRTSEIKLLDWNICKPIILEARMYDGAFRKIKMDAIMGKQRINLGGCILDDVDDHQFVVKILCGLNYIQFRSPMDYAKNHDNIDRNVLKLLEFSVFHGTNA